MKNNSKAIFTLFLIAGIASIIQMLFSIIITSLSMEEAPLIFALISVNVIRACFTAIPCFVLAYNVSEKHKTPCLPLVFMLIAILLPTLFATCRSFIASTVSIFDLITTFPIVNVLPNYLYVLFCAAYSTLAIIAIFMTLKNLSEHKI